MGVITQICGIFQLCEAHKYIFTLGYNSFTHVSSFQIQEWYVKMQYRSKLLFMQGTLFLYIFLIKVKLNFEEWKWNGTKCYWTKKQIEPFSIHPFIQHNQPTIRVLGVTFFRNSVQVICAVLNVAGALKSVTNSFNPLSLVDFLHKSIKRSKYSDITSFCKS